jgi:hypothetical protein
MTFMLSPLRCNELFGGAHAVTNNAHDAFVQATNSTSLLLFLEPPNYN